MTSPAQFFISSTSGALLRRLGGTDTAFVKGRWIPTQTIMEYMIGEDSNVEAVTGERARLLHRALTDAARRADEAHA